MELVVKENSLWRLLFLTTYQQIKSTLWLDREAVQSVLCRRTGPKGNQEARQDLKLCPSRRERKRLRSRVKQGEPYELYAFPLHCQP